MKVDYCLVFRTDGEDKFYEFSNLYYDRESKNLIVVCDSDYLAFKSELDDELIELPNSQFTISESDLELPFSDEEGGESV